jgi:hypothetical protein
MMTVTPITLHGRLGLWMMMKQKKDVAPPLRLKR